MSDRLIYAKQGRTEAFTREELLRYRESDEGRPGPARGSALPGLTRPEWQQHAACRGVDPDLFFPDKGDRESLAKARAYCALCPVTAECLAAVMAMPRAFLELGVWGGTSGRQRRAMVTKARRANRPADPRAPIKCKFCDGQFVPVNGNSLYCSKKCKIARDNRTRWAARNKTNRAA